MKYARTENNIVVQIVGNDPARLFSLEHAALFLSCSANVEPGWLYDGTDYTAPPEKPVSVPQVVTMRQARLALLGAGLLANVNAAIAGLTEPSKSAALIDWEYSAVVQRDSGLVPAMGAALGMTSAQIDALFVTAATL